MEIIKEKIKIEDLTKMAKSYFGNMVKAVVDLKQEIMAVDGELHSDEEALLLENGSAQENLWGINLYPEISGDHWIEFDSMINIRPSAGNRSRGVDQPEIRNKIIEIVNRLIQK